MASHLVVGLWERGRVGWVKLCHRRFRVCPGLGCGVLKMKMEGGVRSSIAGAIGSGVYPEGHDLRIGGRDGILPPLNVAEMDAIVQVLAEGSGVGGLWLVGVLQGVPVEACRGFVSRVLRKKRFDEPRCVDGKWAWRVYG